MTANEAQTTTSQKSYRDIGAFGALQVPNEVRQQRVAAARNQPLPAIALFGLP